MGIHAFASIIDIIHSFNQSAHSWSSIRPRLANHVGRLPRDCLRKESLKLVEETLSYSQTFGNIPPRFWDFVQ